MQTRFAALLTLLSFSPLCQAGAKPLHGQIIIDLEHPQWLKRHGGKHVFICGPGDPEDFLYLGKRNPDGTRDGDQVQRINRLIEHGGNCIYMQIVRSHGGDAKKDFTQNPFIDSDPAKGVDDRILNQWEEWFTLMDRHDIPKGDYSATWMDCRTGSIKTVEHTVPGGDAAFDKPKDIGSECAVWIRPRGATKQAYFPPPEAIVQTSGRCSYRPPG